MSSLVQFPNELWFKTESRAPPALFCCRNEVPGEFCSRELHDLKTSPGWLFYPPFFFIIILIQTIFPIHSFPELIPSCGADNLPWYEK